MSNIAQLLIHPHVGGPLDFFQFLAVVNKAIMCIILLKACKSLYSTFIPRIEEELGCLQLSGSSFLVTQSSSSWNDRLHKRLEVVH